jgi:hypothetical protein
MAGAGRNDPCPCGSGKKFKKCCLGKDRGSEARILREQEGPGPAAKALDWIQQNFPEEAWVAVIGQYCEGLTEDELQELRGLPAQVRDMFFLNAHEWVLAEGVAADGRRFIDHVLGEDGPALTASDRLFLEALGSTPLDLYEVVESRPGEGLILLSKTDPKAEPIWVVERSGSRSLGKGDHIGARLLALEPAIVSGAVYFFSSGAYLNLRSELFGKRRRAKPDPTRISRSIVHEWLSVLVAPPPRLVDASTGDPLVLTTVLYRIRDLEALRKSLRTQPDVEEDENGWVRFEDPKANVKRPLYELTRKGPNRLEVFARTVALADQAERWISRVAGGSIQKLTRALEDPRHLWKNRFQDRPERSPDEVLESLSPEQMTELVENLHRQMYANWADEPIPYLKGKTPRQAIRSKAGRMEVIELLRTYEIGERKEAEEQRRAPADFGFLWDELGLERS